MISRFSLLVFKKEGMGFGDVKLMGSLGFLFGIKGIIAITLLSFVIGATIGIISVILTHGKLDSYIPFGPFIVISTFIILIVPPDNIINIYLDFCLMLSNFSIGIIEKVGNIK